MNFRLFRVQFKWTDNLLKNMCSVNVFPRFLRVYVCRYSFMTRMIYAADSRR